MKAGRKKTKNRQQTTTYIDRVHLERMKGLNRSDIVNRALADYFAGIDHEERRNKETYIGVVAGTVPSAFKQI